MKNKLRKLDTIQFYIQFTTAVLFMWKVLEADQINYIGFSIALLLFIGWTLGYWRHRIIRRRLNKTKTSNKVNYFITDLIKWLRKEKLEIDNRDTE